MSQESLVAELKRQIADGYVIVVMGTGVSITTCQDQQVEDFPVARWDGLLRHGVQWCHHVEHVVDDKEAEPAGNADQAGEHRFSDLTPLNSLRTACAARPQVFSIAG